MYEWWIGNELQRSRHGLAAKREHIPVGYHPDRFGLRYVGALSILWKLHSFDHRWSHSRIGQQQSVPHSDRSHGAGRIARSSGSGWSARLPGSARSARKSGPRRAGRSSRCSWSGRDHWRRNYEHGSFGDECGRHERRQLIGCPSQLHNSSRPRRPRGRSGSSRSQGSARCDRGDGSNRSNWSNWPSRRNRSAGCRRSAGSDGTGRIHWAARPGGSHRPNWSGGSGRRRWRSKTCEELVD